MKQRKIEQSANPRKLLVVSQLPPPVHGSTIMTRIFIAAMNETSITTDLIDKRFSKSIGEVGRKDLRKALAIPSLLVRTIKLSRGHQQCVYFSTTNKGSAVVDALLMSILRLRGISIVNYIHTVGYTDLAQTRLGRLLCTVIFASSNSIVCLSPSLMKDVSPWSRHRPVQSIQNICEPPPSKSTDDGGTGQAASKQPYVLFLSNLLATKGPRDFIDVAANLARRHPEVRFVIAGAAPDDETVVELSRHAEFHGVRSRVDFVGPVYDLSKWNLLRGAEVLLFPSTYPREAQPLTLVEALAVGLPVVAYSVGGVQDLLDASPNGQVVAAGDAGAMAERASAILDMRAPTRVEDYGRMRSGFIDAWLEVLDKLASP